MLRFVYCRQSTPFITKTNNELVFPSILPASYFILEPHLYRGLNLLKGVINILGHISKGKAISQTCFKLQFSGNITQAGINMAKILYKINRVRNIIQWKGVGQWFIQSRLAQALYACPQLMRQHSLDVSLLVLVLLIDSVTIRKIQCNTSLVRINSIVFFTVTTESRGQ